MLLFDEQEKSISSESKATDNKEDEFKKIINDTMKDMEKEYPSSNECNTTNESPSSNEPPSPNETPSSSEPTK